VLLFVIGDVRGGHERDHALARAPERNEHGREQAESQGLLALARELAELAFEDRQTLGRKKSLQRLELLRDVIGRGKEPVEQNDRRQGREEGEKGMQREARCHDGGVVRCQLFLYTQRNVEPSSWGNLLRLVSVPSSPRLAVEIMPIGRDLVCHE